jgi:hypothetical protein
MDDSEEAYAPSKFERIAQSLQEALRQQHNLDPSGEQRTVAVIVTTTQGKTWDIIADSTEDSHFSDLKVYSKMAVDEELARASNEVQKTVTRLIQENGVDEGLKQSMDWAKKVKEEISRKVNPPPQD